MIVHHCNTELDSAALQAMLLVSKLRSLNRVLRCVIISLCHTRTGNYQTHEFDWLKWILTAV